MEKQYKVIDSLNDPFDEETGKPCEHALFIGNYRECEDWIAEHEPKWFKYIWVEYEIIKII